MPFRQSADLRLSLCFSLFDYQLAEVLGSVKIRLFGKHPIPGTVMRYLRIVAAFVKISAEAVSRSENVFVDSVYLFEHRKGDERRYAPIIIVYDRVNPKDFAAGKL